MCVEKSTSGTDIGGLEVWNTQVTSVCHVRGVLHVEETHNLVLFPGTEGTASTKRKKCENVCWRVGGGDGMIQGK